MKWFGPNYKIIGGTFSFSVLQFLGIWTELFSYNHPNSFFLPILNYGKIISLFLATLTVFFITLFITVILSKKCNVTVARILIFLILLSLVNPITLNGKLLTDREWIVFFINTLNQSWFYLALLAVFIFSLLKPIYFYNIFGFVLLILVPFCLFQVIGGFSSLISNELSKTNYKKETKSYSNNNFLTKKMGEQKIIWIVFDELDNKMFGNSPYKNINTEALNEFTKNFLDFENVVQEKYHTITNVPEMLIGNSVVSAKAIDSVRLAISMPRKKKQKIWHQEENLFSELALGGAKIGVLGWYFPYCRIFLDYLKRCQRIELRDVPIRSNYSFLSNLWFYFKSLNPLFPRLRAVEEYSWYRKKIMDMVVDPDLNFIYFHLPFPHQPTIYDGARESLSAINFRKNGYLDNTVLVTRLLQNIRHQMQKYGTWDNTVFVISSDHGWRNPYLNEHYGHIGRVPLFIKFPQNRYNGKIKTPFPMTKIKELMLRISDQSIMSAETVKSWLDSSK